MSGTQRLRTSGAAGTAEPIDVAWGRSCPFIVIDAVEDAAFGSLSPSVGITRDARRPLSPGNLWADTTCCETRGFDTPVAESLDQEAVDAERSLIGVGARCGDNFGNRGDDAGSGQQAESQLVLEVRGAKDWGPRTAAHLRRVADRAQVLDK